MYLNENSGASKLISEWSVCPESDDPKLYKFKIAA